MTYAALTCRSHFSFLEGASHPAELIERAARWGIEAIGLTDRDGLYGVVRAWDAAKDHHVRLIYGADVSVDDGSRITLLAMNRDGYGRLSQLITQGRMRCTKGQSKVSWDEVCASSEGLIALWGGHDGALAQPALHPRLGGRLREAFGDRLYAMIWRHLWPPVDASPERYVRHHASRLGLPLVASTEVLYHCPARRALQDVLTSIRHGTTLHAAGALLRPNGGHAILPPQRFEERFADLPAAVARTREVAQRCVFDLAEIRYRYPSEALPDGRTSSQWLHELTFEGARQRYGGRIPEPVQKQLERELAVIDQLDYCGYFLTMWEVVQFCRERDILCQGRGSAANSAVCFCLGITAIDPVRLDLLFERFLSVERAEPPDIDLDIQHGRREEVIQHVYAKYGRSHAAMVANVIRYRGRSALREIGKVLDLPGESIERVARILGAWGQLSVDTLEQAGVDSQVAPWPLLLRLVEEIQDCPRHLGIHPGGFLLGHEPVTRLVPVENATMEGRTVIQWDKADVEALGLFKVDLLGLGALTHLDLCFKLLKQHHGRELSMATIPAEDPATYDLICAADTVGMFQIESRAQMAMLPRLRPRTFYDLVIEVSIVRPGPITGDMVHPYLRRRRGQEAVTYPHPVLEPVLEKTLGVPLFQEQVMKLAVVAADYSPGEADQLRRDMAAWRSRGKIEQHRHKLIARMRAKGIEETFAERVFNQIRGFGEYGFPESHAASFALISYATGWLRAHYPATFTAGLLNAQPMGFYAPATIVDDAKRHGIKVLSVSVMDSAWDCTLVPWPVTPGCAEHCPSYMTPEPFAVQMGARFVRGLRRQDWQKLVDARTERPFESLDDLYRRGGLSKRALDSLAQAGAFEGFNVNRRQALWSTQAAPRRVAGQPMLPLESLAPLPGLADLDAFHRVTWDYHALGHSTRAHPLETVREELTRRGIPTARALGEMGDGVRSGYAGFVICRQRPATAAGVTFMTLEDETGFVNLVVWERVFERYRVLAKTCTLLGVTGTVQAADGVTHLVAEELWRVPLSTRLDVVTSRDFR